MVSFAIQEKLNSPYFYYHPIVTRCSYGHHRMVVVNKNNKILEIFTRRIARPSPSKEPWYLHRHLYRYACVANGIVNIPVDCEEECILQISPRNHLSYFLYCNGNLYIRDGHGHRTIKSGLIWISEATNDGMIALSEEGKVFLVKREDHEHLNLTYEGEPLLAEWVRFYLDMIYVLSRGEIYYGHYAFPEDLTKVQGVSGVERFYLDFSNLTWTLHVIRSGQNILTLDLGNEEMRKREKKREEIPGSESIIFVSTEHTDGCGCHFIDRDGKVYHRRKKKGKSFIPCPKLVHVEVLVPKVYSRVKRAEKVK